MSDELFDDTRLTIGAKSNTQNNWKVKSSTKLKSIEKKCCAKFDEGQSQIYPAEEIKVYLCPG